MDLYDLRTFTYRNESLYSYDYDVVILDDEEVENFRAIMMLMSNSGNNDRLITVSRHSEISEGSFTCGGRCECFENDFELESEERRALFGANLIYSYRFMSVLVVSTIGFAVAKFVNDHVEECYLMARKAKKIEDMSLNHRDYYCYLDEVECEEEEEEEEEEGSERVYCVGHCVLNEHDFDIARPKLWGKDQSKVRQKRICENRVCPPKRIVVPPSVYYNKNKHDIMMYAKVQYASNHLFPYCTSAKMPYKSEETGEMLTKCTSEGSSNYENIECSYDSMIVNRHNLLKHKNIRDGYM